MVNGQCNWSLGFDECTLETCCRAQAILTYSPSLPATAAYIAIFAILLVLQFGIGAYYRTWTFCIPMTCGLILELIGYAARILIRSNPFDLSIFLAYFIPLGLGPAFLTASIYLTLGRIVIIYGQDFSRILPRTYTVSFVTIDILSLCIQAVGGALTSSAETDSARTTGTNILIAGLTLQAVSLAAFLALCIEFGIKVRRGDKALRNPAFDEFRSTRRFKLFLWAIAIAAFSILIRCIYRIVELAQGFNGKIANEEVPFLILEGPLIMIAVLALTVLHPGIVFRGGNWVAAGWKLRPGKHVGGQEKTLERITSSDGEGA